LSIPGTLGIGGTWIQDEHPGSYFRELGNNFFGLKILKLFYVDPDPGSGIIFTLDLGSKKEKFESGINVPDLQHWL
jgi:hypothetical protein